MKIFIIRFLCGISILANIIFLIIFSIPKPDEEEIAKIVSPDGLVEAIIVERMVPAFSKTPKVVYLVQKGESEKTKSTIFIGLSMRNLEVKWNGNRHLNISYDTGTVKYFNNIYELDARLNLDWVLVVLSSNLSKE